MAKVPGFSTWWDGQRRLLADDAAAAFFLKFRNFSQKEGRISLVGRSFSASSRRRGWSYRFAGNTSHVPSALLHRDVADLILQMTADEAVDEIPCCHARASGPLLPAARGLA